MPEVNQTFVLSLLVFDEDGKEVLPEPIDIVSGAITSTILAERDETSTDRGEIIEEYVYVDETEIDHQWVVHNGRKGAGEHRYPISTKEELFETQLFEHMRDAIEHMVFLKMSSDAEEMEPSDIYDE